MPIINAPKSTTISGRLTFLAGQVEEGYGVGIGDGQQEENKKNQDFDDGRDEFHGLLRVGRGWGRPSENGISLNDLPDFG